ncbi:MAG: RsmB/NOP family class I SAM-dependent RNA methyltransferase [Pseudomonadota bacterium]|nr:RsmB/NOP family class I SAM-dependent RNA methyltransferase [Pseudomonadota bacterium]
MRSAARLASVIEILEKVEDENLNIDHLLIRYFKQRRYAGSKDRRQIRERIYRIVRNRFKLEWWLQEVIEERYTSRLLVLSDLAFFEFCSQSELDEIFNGAANNPERLSQKEKEIYQALVGKDICHVKMPTNVKFECPDWIFAKLEPVFGGELEKCLIGLGEEASLDLRVNALKKITREQVQILLEKFDIKAEKTNYSPLGLRIHSRRRIDQIKPFRDGLLEIQDEGSQIISMLVDAKPGMQIADFCSGAGGKTLAMGSFMANKGRILALDTSLTRLDKAALRIKRAGLHNVERRLIGGEADPKLKRLAKKFDRVLVDAPCSGIGTWRRDPDIRQRLNRTNLEAMVQVQQKILVAAARLVRPGGRLIYATCSLLPDENEKQIENLLIKRNDYSIVSVKEIWSKLDPKIKKWHGMVKNKMMRLTPHQHGTDGFFISILERLH